MAIPVLYAFLEDDALYLPGKFNFTSISNDQGYGILAGEASNYFIAKASIDDIRTNRLQVLDSKRPYGNLRLLFDANRIEHEQLTNLTDLDLQRLFNVVERLYLQQNYSDSNIESMLTSEAAYTGYVANTFTHSTNIGSARIRNRDNKNLTQVSLYDWYSFEFLGEEVESEDEEVAEEEATPRPHLRIRFWVKREDFRTNYPFTTITSVIPPCDPAQLVDPLGLTSSLNLDILNNSSNFILSGVDAETSARDQSGTYKYTTKYVVDDARVTTICFGINYCGPRVPTSLECRKAIREYLTENTTMTEEHLKSIFPELYIQARFYVAPYWSWKKELSDRVVYPSIWNVSSLSKTVAKLWPDTDSDFALTHAEIFTQAADKMLLLTIPDELNERILSIREIFPLYNDWNTTSANWRMLPILTQDFAGKIMRCLSVLKGESMSDEFLSTNIDNVRYLSFTSNEAEFLVMTEVSFNELMNRDD